MGPPPAHRTVVTAPPLLPGIPGRPWRHPGALKGFHDCPGRPPRPPRWPNMPPIQPKIAPRGPKMAPRRPKMASRWLKEPPRQLERPLRGASGEPEEAKTNGFPQVFHWFLDSHVSGLPSAQVGPGGPQDRSKAPKVVLRSSKSVLRATKSGQDGSWNDLGVILRHFGVILGSKMCGFPFVFQYFLLIRIFAPTSLPKVSWSVI